MEGDPNSQFWTRKPTRTSSSASTASSSSNSSILKPWILVLTLSILFLFFFPSKTFTSRVSNLKNGWDSLNFALVLFAILCAFLARNNADDDKTISQPLPPPISTNRWFDGYADVAGHPPSDRIDQPIGRLRRSSSSYPDLRQPQWVPADEWRFSDDIGIYKKEPKWNHYSVPEYSGVKTIFVDRVQSPSPPPPPPSPPPVIWRRTRPNPRMEIEPEIEEKREAVIIPPAPPPPARRRLRNPSPIKFQDQTESVIPPPPPPPARRRLRNPSPFKFQEETESVIPPPPPETTPAVKGKKSHKRTNSGGKDLAAAIARFYQKKRKNAGRKRSYDETHIYHSPPSPPTPPPPPPQKHVSVLNQLFQNKKERSKSKRVHTSAPPRPPPPPPPRGRPPVAPVMKTRNVVEEEIIIDSVTSSPLRPPPPPPAAMFCPSPDVDTKADMFIARLHEGWRLEKMKSIKEKQKKKEVPVAGAESGGDRNA